MLIAFFIFYWFVFASVLKRKLIYFLLDILYIIWINSLILDGLLVIVL